MADAFKLTKAQGADKVRAAPAAIEDAITHCKRKGPGTPEHTAAETIEDLYAIITAKKGTAK